MLFVFVYMGYTSLCVLCVLCDICACLCVSVCMQKDILYIYTRVQACPLLGAMDPEMSEKSSESQ